MDPERDKLREVEDYIEGILPDDFGEVVWLDEDEWFDDDPPVNDDVPLSVEYDGLWGASDFLIEEAAQREAEYEYELWSEHE